MKKNRFNKKLSNNSGIILFIVLWMLVILSMLAISIGRGTNIDLALAKYGVGKVKSKYYAWAGLMTAMSQIQRDTDDSDSNTFDTLFYCGIPGDQQMSSVDYFKNVAIGNEGIFDVGSNPQNLDFSDQAGKDTRFTNYQIVFDDQTSYGLVDEERKININALTTQNVEILVALITLLGFDEEIAHVISYSVLDWRDTDEVVSHQNWGTESEYYESLTPSYKAKNFQFESLAELKFMRGMTNEIYQEIEPYVTIFPKEDNFRINFDTASVNVLKALSHAFTGNLTNTEPADADSLTEKMVNYRSGDDGIEATDDDPTIELNELQLNSKERTLFLVMNQFRTRVSNYFRIHARGQEKVLGVSTYIDAVVERTELAIVQWHRY